MYTNQNNETTIICSPVKGAGYVVPGSIQNICSVCFQEVWVAPSGQKEIARGAKIMCIRCAMPRIQEDPNSKILDLNSEQIAEIRAWQTQQRMKGRQN